MNISGIDKNNYAQSGNYRQIANIIKLYVTGSDSVNGDPANKIANSQSGDSVAISDEGKQKIEEQKQRILDKLKEMENMKQEMARQAEAARQQSDAMGEAMDVRTKCLMIAINIMSGDKVPQEDHNYLIKNDPELYFRAITMRMQKENAEECKRVSEDEEAEGGEAAGGSESVRETLQSSAAAATEGSGSRGSGEAGGDNGSTAGGESGGSAGE